ncbi:uncharacterized protein A4U43_C04F11230 [Asparagus officinalis]|uniref:Uncharacterized protein n=1 Tax=Asparagus officinalis TaxID=4686 RepID=A0A5P1F4G6_ASPOF|nr:uncharacterized protein A4U43_C04F11230 [Asparagus officinalis]
MRVWAGVEGWPLGRIWLKGLGALPHNRLGGQGRRDFERRSVRGGGPAAMCFVADACTWPNREKVRPGWAELLVGLNYVWRFEMEMCLDRGLGLGFGLIYVAVGLEMAG